MRYDIRWLSLIVLHERGALNINILEHRVEIFSSHNPDCCLWWLGLFQGNQNCLGRSVVYVTFCANHVNHIQLKKTSVTAVILLILNTPIVWSICVFIPYQPMVYGDVFWCFDIRGGRHYHASDLGNWLGVGPQVSQGAAMLSERWATQKKVVDTSNL